MNAFRLLFFAPAFLLLFVTAPLQAEITEAGRGIVFGKNFSYSLQAPKGWVLDNENGVADGLHAVFYPKGSSWADGKVIAYASSRPRTAEISSIEAAVKFLVADFHANGSPKYQGRKIKTLKTEGGTEAVLYHFKGDQWGNHEAVAYYLQDKTINFVVLNSRDEKSFTAALPAFDSLAASYSYLGDTPIKKP